MSDETLWAAVLQFFQDDLPNYSLQGYDSYWRDRGLASAAFIPARLGARSDVKARLRQLMRYAAAPDGTWGWDEAVLQVSPENEPRNIMSKKACAEALVAVAAQTVGPFTVQMYEESRERGHPNAALVQSRFGSWVRALVDADLGSRMSARARNKWAATVGIEEEAIS